MNCLIECYTYNNFIDCKTPCTKPIPLCLQQGSIFHHNYYSPHNQHLIIPFPFESCSKFNFTDCYKNNIPFSFHGCGFTGFNALDTSIIYIANLIYTYKFWLITFLISTLFITCLLSTVKSLIIGLWYSSFFSKMGVFATSIILVTLIHVTNAQENPTVQDYTQPPTNVYRTYDYDVTSSQCETTYKLDNLTLPCIGGDGLYYTGKKRRKRQTVVPLTIASHICLPDDVKLECKPEEYYIPNYRMCNMGTRIAALEDASSIVAPANIKDAPTNSIQLGYIRSPRLHNQSNEVYFCQRWIFVDIIMEPNVQCNANTPDLLVSIQPGTQYDAYDSRNVGGIYRIYGSLQNTQNSTQAELMKIERHQCPLLSSRVVKQSKISYSCAHIDEKASIKPVLELPRELPSAYQGEWCPIGNVLGLHNWLFYLTFANHADIRYHGQAYTANTNLNLVFYDYYYVYQNVSLEFALNTTATTHRGFLAIRTGKMSCDRLMRLQNTLVTDHNHTQIIFSLERYNYTAKMNDVDGLCRGFFLLIKNGTIGLRMFPRNLYFRFTDYLPQHKQHCENEYVPITEPATSYFSYCFAEDHWGYCPDSDLDSRRARYNTWGIHTNLFHCTKFNQSCSSSQSTVKEGDCIVHLACGSSKPYFCDPYCNSFSCRYFFARFALWVSLICLIILIFLLNFLYNVYNAWYNQYLRRYFKRYVWFMPFVAYHEKCQHDFCNHEAKYKHEDSCYDDKLWNQTLNTDKTDVIHTEQDTVINSSIISSRLKRSLGTKANVTAVNNHIEYGPILNRRPQQSYFSYRWIMVKRVACIYHPAFPCKYLMYLWLFFWSILFGNCASISNLNSTVPVPSTQGYYYQGISMTVNECDEKKCDGSALFEVNFDQPRSFRKFTLDRQGTEYSYYVFINNSYVDLDLELEYCSPYWETHIFGHRFCHEPDSSKDRCSWEVTFAESDCGPLLSRVPQSLSNCPYEGFCATDWIQSDTRGCFFFNLLKPHGSTLIRRYWQPILNDTMYCIYRVKGLQPTVELCVMTTDGKSSKCKPLQPGGLTIKLDDITFTFEHSDIPIHSDLTKIGVEFDFRRKVVASLFEAHNWPDWRKGVIGTPGDFQIQAFSNYTQSICTTNMYKPDTPLECRHDNGAWWDGEEQWTSSCISRDEPAMGCNPVDVPPGNRVVKDDPSTWKPEPSCALTLLGYKYIHLSNGRDYIPHVNVQSANCYQEKSFMTLHLEDRRIHRTNFEADIKISKIVKCTPTIDDNLQTPCEILVNNREKFNNSISFYSTNHFVTVLPYHYNIGQGINDIVIYLDVLTDSVSNLELCITETKSCFTYTRPLNATARGKSGHFDYDANDVWLKNVGTSNTYMANPGWYWYDYLFLAIGIAITIIVFVIVIKVLCSCDCSRKRKKRVTYAKDTDL
jgi:hypothetical protein